MYYDIPSAAVAGGPRSLREIVSERQAAYGGWCTIPSAFATEIVSASGCDWLCIDLQHGLVGEEAMRVMVQAAAIRKTPALVRVAWNEPSAIMRALDAGADGVIVPMVNTAEEARRAAAASHYPPVGSRSWGPLRSTMAQPGFNPAIGNEQAVCLVMIETVEAFENSEEILSEPGVDGVFVGPNDLCISHTGSCDGAESLPRQLEMMEHIAQVALQRGLVAGTMCSSGDDVLRWQRMGYTLLSLPSEAALLANAIAGEIRAARASGASE